MPRLATLCLIAGAMALAGCDDMAAQPKDKTWHAAEPPPNGLQWPLLPPVGMVDRSAPEPPPVLSAALLARGRERFDIYCAPCHDRTGSGHGMIVQRGFPQPPDYIEPRLINAPTSHFYDVITLGYGAMYSYAERVQPRDRWAIAAYIRVLQQARGGTVADVPPNHQRDLR